MAVNDRLDATLGPCDQVSKFAYIDEGLNAGVNVGLDGVDGLVASSKDCQCFKTLCMAWPSVDFKHVNTSSFCNTTFF
jgi:hypothetical protein